MLKTYTGQSSGALGFWPSLRQMTHKKIFLNTFWILFKCVPGQYFTVTCKLTLFFPLQANISSFCNITIWPENMQPVHIGPSLNQQKFLTGCDSSQPTPGQQNLYNCKVTAGTHLIHTELTQSLYLTHKHYVGRAWESDSRWMMQPIHLSGS